MLSDFKSEDDESSSPLRKPRPKLFKYKFVCSEKRQQLI